MRHRPIRSYNKRQISRVGQLILNKAKVRSVRRSAVAHAIGLTPKVFWEVIWAYRPLPVARLVALVDFLQLTAEETDELMLADAADRIIRSRKFQRESIPKVGTDHEGSGLPPHGN